jgi:hypothetical protein
LSSRHPASSILHSRGRLDRLCPRSIDRKVGCFQFQRGTCLELIQDLLLQVATICRVSVAGIALSSIPNMNQRSIPIQCAWPLVWGSDSRALGCQHYGNQRLRLCLLQLCAVTKILLLISSFTPLWCLSSGALGKYFVSQNISSKLFTILRFSLGTSNYLIRGSIVLIFSHVILMSCGRVNISEKVTSREYEFPWIVREWRSWRSVLLMRSGVVVGTCSQWPHGTDISYYCGILPWECTYESRNRLHED